MNFVIVLLASLNTIICSVITKNVSLPLKCYIIILCYYYNVAVVTVSRVITLTIISHITLTIIIRIVTSLRTANPHQNLN